MKKNLLKTILTIVVSLAFAALFMWLALRGLDVKKIKNAFLKADYFWVFASAFFGVFAYWLRAIRWNLLFEPLGYKISNSNALWTVSFGYLMNLTIPRSGEIARATALYGVEKIPADKSFGTIILERIVDFVCMLGFLVLTMLFKHDAILSFYEKSNIKINPIILIAAILVLILGIFAFFRFKKYLIKYPFFAKIINFIDGIFQGITSIFKLKQKGKFIFYTLAIWICYYFAAYLVCFSLPETSDFSVADGFYIIVIGTLGMMIPASGGFGAFHFAMRTGIAALFFSMGKNPDEGAEIGLSYAFISHTLQIIIMLVMGLISIPMLAKKEPRIKIN
ncbi:MAG: flippase-like domain-containing protein [Flavobacteriaceae bacterium]|jgi:uncharacterized protein (TIRG00374 family)|nr:flippase-like domain-containing protein [Flavobacteriaceae bacterium]